MAKKSIAPKQPSIRDLLRVEPGSFRLSDVDPNAIAAGPHDKEKARAECASLEAPVSELHDRLFAAAKRTDGGCTCKWCAIEGQARFIAAP